MIIVSNASPLIIPAKISYFHLPQRLFNEITISEDVWDEVVIKGAGLPGSAETQQAISFPAPENLQKEKNAGPPKKPAAQLS